MFRIGDRIVHPMHGAGVIEDIVAERFGGVCRDYYVFRLPFGGLLLKIPVASSALVGIRPVVNPAEATALLDRLSGLEEDMSANWSQRHRENMDRIRSGDLYEVARVIKGLMGRDRLRGLSTGERKMLHSAKQILISEIALATGGEYDAVERRVNEAVLAEGEKEWV